MLQDQTEVELPLTGPEKSGVEQLIIDAIREGGGSISFAEYMEISLYARESDSDSQLDAGIGYYSSGEAEITHAGGDFSTSPEITPVFGATTAEAIYNYWSEMGRPDNFMIVEMGAGNGTWAQCILDEIESNFTDLNEASSYTIIEYSSGMIAKQRERLEDRNVEWVLGSARDIPLQGVTGIFISNELPDAFPVNRVIMTDGELRELRVGLDAEDNLIERIGDLVDDETAEYLSHGNSMEEGDIVAVNFAAADWMRQLSGALESGYILTIDYGDWFAFDQNRYPISDARMYYGGLRYPARDLIESGQADITSDVDFTMLEQVGEEAGLETVFAGTQAEFLGNNNVRERLDERRALAAQGGVEDRELTPSERVDYIEGGMPVDWIATTDNFLVLVQGKK